MLHFVFIYEFDPNHVELPLVHKTLNNKYLQGSGMLYQNWYLHNDGKYWYDA